GEAIDRNLDIPNGEDEIVIDNIDRNSARISFKTVDANDGNSPFPTNATVRLYADPELANEVFSFSELGTNYNVDHAIKMIGLEEGVTYYAKITVVDSTGRNTKTLGYDAGNNVNLTFTTTGKLTSISTPSVPVLTDKKAVINFNTNQPARCAIAYGTISGSGNYSEVPISEADYNSNHAIHIPGLIFSTKYYYQINCMDSNDNALASSEYDFTTLETQTTEDEVRSGDDTAAPIISGISSSNVTGESATITWTTNEKANSLVQFGISSADENVAGNAVVNFDTANYVTSHSVIIRNLIPATKYLFKVGSLDKAGNISQSSESSFTTSAPSSLSAVKVVSRNLSQAIITWETEKESSSIVEYGLTTAYGEKKESNTKTRNHEIIISGLKAKSVYHFRVKGVDSNGNLYASSDNTFEPKSPPQIDNLKTDSVSEHGALIKFTTDVPTDALITYADVKDAKETGSQGKPELTSKHEIELKNLKSGITYSLKIRVRDEAGNETEENFPNFTTGKDENAPKIDNLKTDSALASSDKVQSIISWITNEPATTEVVYREGRMGEEKVFKVKGGYVTNHVAVITSFKPGTVYYFKARSTDEAGNEAMSTDFALLTPRVKENIVQIIIGNFQDIFGWAKF
ncbi:MAG TPA: hypothetical protein DIT25_03800, partial [Candidatus Moranbacteria bacterium]|nr:hypothetical protein [Candidatus Moranbacteria bacterium]